MAQPRAARLDLLRVARQVLESADAAHGSDPRLPFFYGRILVDLSEDRLAVGVLADALARAGDHPGASDAWFALAIAYARLNDPTAEVAAYDAQLAREIDPEARSVTLNNQAEGFVLAGDLDTATSKYRAALELTPDSGLAHWGFAVTLDRSGDLFAALEEARLALVYDPVARRLRSDEVFFIPAYDKHWYLALGAMVQAKTDPDATSRLIAWEQAAVLWRKYLDDAVVTDPWVAMARARLALCVKELGRRNTKPAPAFTSRGVRR